MPADHLHRLSLIAHHPRPSLFHGGRRRGRAHSEARLVAAALLCVLISGTVPAKGDAGEAMLTAAIGSQIGQFIEPSDPQHQGVSLAPCASVAGFYALTDYWHIGGRLTGGVEVLDPLAPRGIVHGSAVARYVIDALQWIPTLEVGVGVLGKSGAAGNGDGALHEPVTFSAHVGLGLEYRPQRHWGVGGGLRYHLLPTQITEGTGPFELTLGMTWYFDTGH